MSALSRFERFVEGIVEGSFARLMRSQLQPVEIAKRLAREMEERQSVAAGGKLLVPNEYEVFLSPEDFRLYEAGRAAWEHELSEYLAGLAKERGLALFSQPSVTLRAGQGVPSSQVRIESRVTDRDVAPAGEPAVGSLGRTDRIDVKAVREAIAAAPSRQARLILAAGAQAGASYEITKPMVLVGRAMDNDVVLEDANVSRYHAEIRLRGEHFYLRDLKSTNGTRVNGEEVTERTLSDGDRLSLGGLGLVFRIGQ